ATTADDGRSYRAYFFNEFGGFYSDDAKLTVNKIPVVAEPVPTPDPTIRPTSVPPSEPTIEPTSGSADDPTHEAEAENGEDSKLAATGFGTQWAALAILGLLIIGAGTIFVGKRVRGNE